MLTPKQFGKAVVQSYPFYLDGTVLVELLATDGQPQNHVQPVPLPPVSVAFIYLSDAQPACSSGEGQQSHGGVHAARRNLWLFHRVIRSIPVCQALTFLTLQGIGANSLFANLAVSQPELLASLAAGMPVMQSGALAPAPSAKAAGSS